MDVLGHIKRDNPTHGFNRYTYVNNNPYKYNDPTGEVAHIVIGAAAGAVISGAAYALTTQNFKWGDLGVKMAVGAGVGAMTAAVPVGIATGALSFGGAAGNITVGTANAVAAGSFGSLVEQSLSGDGSVDTGQALQAGVANALGQGVGAATAPVAKALATTTTSASAGLPVKSLSGATFNVGKVEAKTTTNAAVQQSYQDLVGEAASALANENSQCVTNQDACN